MTFNEYFTELQIDFDSYFNEFACESIMFELYADENDNVNVAAESLSLTFDDLDDELSATPAFEEAKRSFGDMLKAGFEKVLNFFRTIGNAIANFVRSLMKKKKTEDKTEYEVKDAGDSVEIHVASDSQTTGSPTLLLTQKPDKDEDSTPSKPPASPSQTTTHQTSKNDTTKPQQKQESKPAEKQLNTEQPKPAEQPKKAEQAPVSKTEPQKPVKEVPTEQPKPKQESKPEDNNDKKSKKSFKIAKNVYRSLSQAVKETSNQMKATYTDLIKGFEKLTNTEKALIQIFDQAMKLEVNGKTVAAHLDAEHKSKDSASDYDTSTEDDPKIRALNKKAGILARNSENTAHYVATKAHVLKAMIEKIKSSNVSSGAVKAIASINNAKGINLNDVINRAKEMEKRCDEMWNLLSDIDLYNFARRKKDPNGDDRRSNAKFTACGKMLAHLSNTAANIADCCKSFINYTSAWIGLVM